MAWTTRRRRRQRREAKNLFVSIIAQGDISDQNHNIYDIMYTGIAAREVRLLCNDFGGLYGSEPRNHRAIYSWRG